MVVTVWVAGALAVGLAEAQNEEAQLERVRVRIEALERRLAEQAIERDAGAEALRRVEMSVAEAAEKLARTRSDLADQQARLRSLEADSARARARLADEQDALQRQVRMSYLAGRQELMKLLLSQENPADLSRMMTYFDYLNRARSTRIRRVGIDMDALRELTASTLAGQERLARLERDQVIELEALREARESRSSVLAGLESRINAADAEVQELRIEEQRLTDLLADLGDILAAFPVDSDEPFAELRGKLAWPISGDLIGDYGRSRGQGAMRWNGVVLGADSGAQVRAVYHGRVAFSDWLPGLGLLMILDHGDGYLSLYGYNEVLLKESGDWVETGEVVAQVGDTGGQQEPALYFELRHESKPIDPHQWMRGPP
jgi:septal ring factor EnvC (AmiA/AmiB activator)